MAEKKTGQRKRADGRGKRPRDANQLAKGAMERSVGDRSDSPRASSPIGKGNEQTAPGPDAPVVETEQANPEEILATESGVSPGTQQENRASTNEDTRLSENQQGEQDAPVPDGVALPATDKSEEAPKATEQPHNPSNDKPPAKPSARDYRRRHDRCVLIANGVMAGAAVVAVVVYGLQWTAMRSQLTAMKEQGKVMSDQLKQMREADRPWVGLAATDRLVNRVDSVPYFENDYAQVSCTIIPQNFGKSPAEVVCCRTELIVTQDANDVTKRLASIRSDPLPSGVSHIVFPETDRVMERITAKTTVPKRTDTFKRDNPFEAHVIVYVVYRDPSGGECHRSAFLYRFYDMVNACAKRLAPPNNADLLLAARDCEWQLYDTDTD